MTGDSLIDILLMIRILFGLFFVLFIPGYAIVWAIFPKKKQLDQIERIVLGFALSIATIPLIIFYSNRLLRIPVNFISVFLVILLVSSAAGLAWYKRKS